MVELPETSYKKAKSYHGSATNPLLVLKDLTKLLEFAKKGGRDFVSL
jgi:hypothetical protein